MITKEIVMQAMSTVQEPELFKDLVTLNMVKDVIINGSDVTVIIELKSETFKDLIKKESIDAVGKIEGVGKVKIEKPRPPKDEHQSNNAITMGGKENLIPTIKNVIMVGAGKGGVGKSTISVNLAISLAQTGAKVGLMDADIYGPSLHLMMGMKDARVMTEDGKIMIPLEKYGVKFITIGSLVDEGQALIWRGPILEGVLKQFLTDVKWGELDYLIIDLPPGTGDVQLSLAQKIKATGSVIVSTPQDVALIDVKRAKTMFDKVEVPILGVIENMSYFLCPHCGDRTDIFSTGGTRKMAKTFGLKFLGELPIDTDLREGGDLGVPIVMEAGPLKDTFSSIAQSVIEKVKELNIKSKEDEKKSIFTPKFTTDTDHNHGGGGSCGH